ncbi:MAG: hypothetical protein M3M94_00325 [Actinomycetota bacterium]|nr:hypothetical protein [Actinomycetota bacterium]
MVGVHRGVGLLVLATALVAVGWGAISLRRAGEPGSLLQHVLVLVQTLLIAQVALGLLLLSGDRRTPDRLHYVYGTLALGAVLSPWFYAPADPRRRLVWFVGTTLVGGALAARAFLTSS